MKPRLAYFIGLLLPLMLLMALPVLARPHAAPNATLDLSWTVIGGGGEIGTTSGNISLSATVGQAAASLATSQGSYTASTGFWFSGTDEYKVYLPLVLR